MEQCHYCGRDKNLIKIGGNFYCNQKCQIDEAEVAPFKRVSAQASLEKALRPYVKNGIFKR